MAALCPFGARRTGGKGMDERRLTGKGPEEWRPILGLGPSSFDTGAPTVLSQRQGGAAGRRALSSDEEQSSNMAARLAGGEGIEERRLLGKGAEQWRLILGLGPSFDS